MGAIVSTNNGTMDITAGTGAAEEKTTGADVEEGDTGAVVGAVAGADTGTVVGAETGTVAGAERGTVAGAERGTVVGTETGTDLGTIPLEEVIPIAVILLLGVTLAVTGIDVLTRAGTGAEVESIGTALPSIILSNATELLPRLGESFFLVPIAIPIIIPEAMTSIIRKGTHDRRLYPFVESLYTPGAAFSSTPAY